MPAGPFTFITVFIMTIISYINGDSNPCAEEIYSPLCFCHSTIRRSLLTNIFLSKISLSQCISSYSTHQCRQGRFSPSSTYVTQLVPNLVNHSQCLENTHCLQTLRTDQRCRQCQIIPSISVTENTSYIISTTTNHLPTDSCFYLCEHDKSCGFLCFDRRISVTVNCNSCRGRRRNVTCRCMRTKQTPTCSSTLIETTTTARWMQKRGFPAAGILALLVLFTILFIIAMKLINHRLNSLTHRQNSSIRRSIATITTYRSRQPSPSTVVSFTSTPVIRPLKLKNDSLPTNTMVELLDEKSQEFVVDIHRRDDEDELSVFLLEKTRKKDSQPKDIVNIDDDDDDDVEQGVDRT